MSTKKIQIGRILLILLGIFLFLFALDLMGNSFEHLGSNAIQPIINAASNPFVGLFIGLLITAIIQSSSTTTTMVVAAVATGSITLQNAIPIIMGANIGTTITSSIVSMGYLGLKQEFRSATSASAIHNFFNIIVVLLLFPLEFKYRLLSLSSEYLASEISSELSPISSSVQFNLLKLSPITNFFTDLVVNPIVSLLISFVLLFASIKLVSHIIYTFLIGKSKKKLEQFVFRSSSKGFFWGTLATAGIQSSSITTSLVVPLAATGKIQLNKLLPFILGANIGTTITAFIAVLFESQTAVNIAIAHLLFNAIGVLLFFSAPALRHFLVWLACRFGNLAAKYRLTIIVYIILVFFIIPFSLIYFSNNG